MQNFPRNFQYYSFGFNSVLGTPTEIFCYMEMIQSRTLLEYATKHRYSGYALFSLIGTCIPHPLLCFSFEIGALQY